MAKKKTRSEIATQLAEACMDMGPGSHPFIIAVDEKKVAVTVNVPGAPRFGVETIKDSEARHGVHYRVFDSDGDHRIATCYDAANAVTVAHALNAMDARTPTGSKKHR